MRDRFPFIFTGFGISIGLTAFTWATKTLPIIILFMLPGWLFAWAVAAALLPFGFGEWKYRNELGSGLVTLGNAVFFALVIRSIRNRSLLKQQQIRGAQL
jgi:hypothetical protein